MKSTGNAMCRLALLIAAGLTVGCEADPDGDEEPPGLLEYDSMVTDFYRLDRRVDMIPVDDLGREPRCGMLTEQAFRDIEETIDDLDPDVDYGFKASGEDCPWSDSPAAWIHIPGFQHSPFECDEFCCHDDLARVPLTYFHVINNFSGTVIEDNGEPYVAIEPDEPCP